MLAVRINEPYKFEYIERPMPEIGDGQVLIKNMFLGVCASDMQVYHGKHKYVKFPLVMGHEVSAEVVKVGKNVKGFTPGDMVVVEPQLVCGECFPCSVGRFNVCENLRVLGIHTDGCACEYYAIDPWNLHKMPEGLSYEKAALVEPLAVGMGSIKRAGDFRGANVVVVGAGAIGNFTAQSAKALGAGKVLITDIIDGKLKLAEDCGIDYCVNTKEVSLDEAIRKSFGDFRRADVIIDCAATGGSFASILAAARKNSKVVISGNFKDPVQFDIPTIQRSEISLIGHMMYVREDYADALRCLTEGSVCTDGIVTGVFDLKEYHKAFEYSDKNPADTIKLLIKIGAK